MSSRRAAENGSKSSGEQLLWQRDFVTLLLSRSISTLGTGMTMVGIVYLMITVTDGAIWVAFLAATYTGFFAMGGVVDSLLGDRFDTRKLLAVGQAVEVPAGVRHPVDSARTRRGESREGPRR